MSKTTSPAFPIYGGDWLKGTARLSGAERGYYFDVLLFIWDSSEPFPTDELDQMRIARCFEKREWRQVWHRIRGKFVETPAGFMHRRVEEERAKLKKNRERKSLAGRSGAERRWHLNGEHVGSEIAAPMADELPEATANGWPSISQSQEPDHKERDQVPAPTRELLTLFDELHQSRFESPAELNRAKDSAIMAGLFRKRGREETERLIRAFFEMTDPWVVQRGFSVGIFKTQIPKLLAAKPAKPAPAREDWWDECKRLHDPRCPDSGKHRHQMDMDALRAARS